MIKVNYFHNILWSTYRLSLFDEIERKYGSDIDFQVYQIARTEKCRVSIQKLSASKLEHKSLLLYDGCYEDLSPVKRAFIVLKAALKGSADVMVITGYSSFESWVLLIYSLLFSRAVIVTIDSTSAEGDRSNVRKLLKRFFLARVNAVLAYGDSSRKLATSLGVNPVDVFCPFHCVEKIYYEDCNIVLSRRSVSSKPEFFRFVFVGRLSSEKGIEVLIEAFKRLSRSQLNIHLSIVGDGPMRDALMNKVESNSIGGKVEFLGAREPSEIIRLYASVNCFVLPSFQEPWGLVVNEALCQGVPVIVSDKCGCIENLVFNNPAAIKFTAGDISGLYGAMYKALSLFNIRGGNYSRMAWTIGNSYSIERAAEVFGDAVKSSLQGRS